MQSLRMQSLTKTAQNFQNLAVEFRKLAGRDLKESKSSEKKGGDVVVCKYCGVKFSPGSNCNHSPNKRHVGVPDGKNCIYCTYTFHSGASCQRSPSGKHQLG